MPSLQPPLTGRSAAMTRLPPQSEENVEVKAGTAKSPREVPQAEGMNVDAAMRTVPAAGWHASSELDPLRPLPSVQTVPSKPTIISDTRPSDTDGSLQRPIKTLPMARRKTVPSQQSNAGRIGPQTQTECDVNMVDRPTPGSLSRIPLSNDPSPGAQMDIEPQEQCLPEIIVTLPPTTPPSLAVDDVIDADMAEPLPHEMHELSPSWCNAAAPLRPQDVDYLLVNGLFEDIFLDSAPTNETLAAPTLVPTEQPLESVLYPAPRATIEEPLQQDHDMSYAPPHVAIPVPSADETVHKVIDVIEKTPIALNSLAIPTVPSHADWYQNLPEPCLHSSASNRSPIPVQFVLSPTADTLPASQIDRGLNGVQAFLLALHVDRRDVSSSYRRVVTCSHMLGNNLFCYAVTDSDDADCDEGSESKAVSVEPVVLESASSEDENDSSASPTSTLYADWYHVVHSYLLLAFFIWTLLRFLLDSII